MGVMAVWRGAGLPAVRTDFDGRPELLEHPARNGRDLFDRGIERRAVPLGWRPVAAHLAHELASRGFDLTGRGRLFGSTEDFDGSAHSLRISRRRPAFVRGGAGWRGGRSRGASA